MSTRGTLSSKRTVIFAVCVAGWSLVVSGCSDSLPSLPKISQLNPFAEKQAPLPGRRVSVLSTTTKNPRI